jgi:hypothetical protein
MTTILSPLGYAVPYIGIDAEGRMVKIHPGFLRYWEMGVDPRIGGSQAPSNTDLNNQISSIQSSEMTAQTAYPDLVVPDTIQSTSSDQIFQDVMQSGDIFSLGDTTFQS